MWYTLCPRYPDTRYPDSSLTGQMAFLVIRTKQWSRYPDKMLVCPDNEDLTARFNLEICGKFRKIVNLKLLVKYFTHTNGKPLILKLTL